MPLGKGNSQGLPKVGDVLEKVQITKYGEYVGLFFRSGKEVVVPYWAEGDKKKVWVTKNKMRHKKGAATAPCVNVKKKCRK